MLKKLQNLWNSCHIVDGFAKLIETLQGIIPVREQDVGGKLSPKCKETALFVGAQDTVYE